MDNREKDSKPKESLKLIRRESMQQKPNVCLDSDRHAEFHSGESETVTEEVTSVHQRCSELFSSFIFFFIFICHSAVSNGSVCLPLLDTPIIYIKKFKILSQKLKYYGHQRLPANVWWPTFFKLPAFVFNRRQKLIQA